MAPSTGPDLRHTFGWGQSYAWPSHHCEWSHHPSRWMHMQHTGAASSANCLKLAPLLYRRCWHSFSRDTCPSVWSFALKSRMYWTSFILRLCPSSQLSLTRSPAVFYGSAVQREKIPWRPPSHLSQLWPSLHTNLRTTDFKVLFAQGDCRSVGDTHWSELTWCPITY